MWCWGMGKCGVEPKTLQFLVQKPSVMPIINKKIDGVNVRVATARALGELSQGPALDAKLVVAYCKATASE